MKFKLPSLAFLSPKNAKLRILVVFLGILLVVMLFLMLMRILGGDDTTGGSTVSGAPRSVKFIPGEETSPEYQRALEQANLDKAKQALDQGTSSVPTQIRFDNNQGGTQTLDSGVTSACKTYCSTCVGSDELDVSSFIEDLTKQKKLTEPVSKKLLTLAKNYSPLSQFEGSLSVDMQSSALPTRQARCLLAFYNRALGYHYAVIGAESMNPYIKRGMLPLESANWLLQDYKNLVLVSKFESDLTTLFNEGKVLQGTARGLLIQYRRFHTAILLTEGMAMVNHYVQVKAILPTIGTQLIDLMKQNVSLVQFQNAIAKLYNMKHLSLPIYKQLLTFYKRYHEGTLAVSGIDQLLKNADKMDPKKKAALKKAVDELKALQDQNASVKTYKQKLQDMVNKGLITQKQANQLLKEYEDAQKTKATSPTGEIALPGTDRFIELQKQEADQPGLSTGGGDQSIGPPIPVDQQKALQQLVSEMSKQSGSLIATWKPGAMDYTSSNPVKTASQGTKLGGSNGAQNVTGTQGASQSTIIKAGTVIFAVLDTTANSDYPESPIMATIVTGKYKGSKLLGKLQIQPGKDRMSLQFTLMNYKKWDSSKSVDAFAIDPETARSALATSVDHHYLMRYGSLFASSFVKGYSDAIMQSGATQVIGSGIISQKHPELSPLQRTLVGLGEVGKEFGKQFDNIYKTNPTVKIKAGVGIGILFMSDLTT